MFRQKAIVNRKDKSADRIVKSTCKHGRKIDKVHPTNTAKIIDKIRTTKLSMKFSLQTRCKNRQNLRGKCNAIDYMHGDTIAQWWTKRLLRNRKTRNFFDVKVHLFCIQRPQTTQKLNPKIKMKIFIPTNLLSSASMTSTELLRWDDVKTRPSPPKIYGQLTDGSRMTLIVDFGWSRQSPDPDRNDHCTISTAMRNFLFTILNCWTAIEVHSSPSTSDCTMTAGGRSLL